MCKLFLGISVWHRRCLTQNLFSF